MQPNQDQGGLPSGNPNPYDFITSTNDQKKPMFGGGGDPFFKKVMILVGGAVVLMIVVGIILSIASSGGGGGYDSMRALIKSQQNLIFITQFGSQEARDPSVKALSITTKLSVQSDKILLSNFLDKKGENIDPKLAPKALDTETQTALEDASTTNRFDETYEEYLRNLLAQYQLDLQAAYNQTSNEEAKTILSNSYDGASTLLSPAVASE